jgi:CheY-like chemotaxis protein
VAEALPDAALLDIQLPASADSACSSTCARARAPAPIPILAVTASVMDTDRARILTRASTRMCRTR